MHDDFTPPGFLTCAQLLELAGKVLLKDECRDDLSPGQFLCEADRLKANGHSERTLFREVELAGRKLRAANRAKIVAQLRAALCTGAFASVILTSGGHLAELPPYFWQGSGGHRHSSQERRRFRAAACSGPAGAARAACCSRAPK
jgi:hypothetical protein